MPLFRSSLILAASELPVGSPARRRLLSRASRLPVPFVRQSTGFSCGAAAFQGVLGFYGLQKSESECARLVGTTEDGTSPQGFRSGSRSCGLQAGLFERSSIDQVTQLLDRGIPPILLLQAWGEEDHPPYQIDTEDGHYVIATGYAGDRIYFEDPSAPEEAWLTRSDLEERWHDEGSDGKKWDHLMVVIVPEAPHP